MFKLFKRKEKQPNEYETTVMAKAAGLHLVEPNRSNDDEIMETLKEMEACENLRKLTGDSNYAQLSFELSIKLARLVGVPEDQILHNKDEIDAYFTDGEPVEL